MTQPEPMSMFDADQLAACVQCGFCLSSCPTYETTHLEEHGPRGRILAMRLVEEGELTIDDPDVVDSLETCVQCRACETVCPSLVQFGSLMETARAEITERQPPRGPEGLAQRLLFFALVRRSLLRVGGILLALAQALRVDRLLPARLRPAQRVALADTLRRYRLPPPGAPVRGEAFLFRGCVMDGLFRDVHRATAQVLAAVGYRPRFEPAPPCCGALSAHAGRESEAHALAEATIAAYAGTTGPVLVNSAGCGGAMKEYGKLLGTEEARAFSARVKDLSELVTPEEVAARGGEVPLTLAYQAPCHLRNVQGLAEQARDLVAAIPGLTLLEPDDEQQCCGSGGIYSYLQPALGDAMLARKDASLQRTGAQGVVSGNPGCAMQIAREGWEIHHPAQLLARSLTP
ncbi:MAG: (Fe-S)-binding protein [Nitriliruptor sp.]|nr:MAG: (Fe-S)-binding protein [Nitriliruptor sp.]